MNVTSVANIATYFQERVASSLRARHGNRCRKWWQTARTFVKCMEEFHIFTSLAEIREKAVCLDRDIGQAIKERGRGI